MNKKVKHLLIQAVAIMDERGKGIDGGASRALWQREWDEMRLNIMKAQELLDKQESMALLQDPVVLNAGPIKPIRRNMPPPIKWH